MVKIVTDSDVECVSIVTQKIKSSFLLFGCLFVKIKWELVTSGSRIIQIFYVAKSTLHYKYCTTVLQVLPSICYLSKST